MMSPDPPKEGRRPSDSDALPPHNPGFIAVWDNEEDDIFGDADGPYELDIGGSEEESDFSQSGDEQEQGQRHPPNYQSYPGPSSQEQGANDDQDPERVEGSSTRGHYQLLIPFPQPSTSSGQEQDDENMDNDGNSISNINIPAGPQASAVPPQSTHSMDNYENTTSPGQTDATAESHRDINLTEENVQVIKSVMLNFSLPSASIPPWASELSDDVLKNRLSECLDGKQDDKSGN